MPVVGTPGSFDSGSDQTPVSATDTPAEVHGAEEDRDATGTPHDASGMQDRAVARGLAVPVLLVAVLVPYALAFSGLWSRTGDDLADARREQAGVVALRPLVRLVAATTDAQTTAVAGGAIDVKALRAVMTEVEAADARVGVTLGSDRRWTDLRSRLEHLISSPPQNSAAYREFTQVIDLEIVMLTAVVDSSGLRVDPQLGVHYLVEAGEIHVPDILVAAGRISDLTLLAGQQQAPTADAVAVGVARSTMHAGLTQLDDGLRKGFDSSASRTLGPNLLRELDRLRDAVTTMAPPMSGIGSAPGTPDTGAARTARENIRSAALETGTAVVDQLDELLRLRIGALRNDRRTQAAVAVVGLAVAVAMLWFLTPGQRREAGTAPMTVSAVPGGSMPVGRVPIGSATATRAGGVQARHSGPGGLLQARQLLESRPLVRAGRAVTSTASTREEAAQPSEEDQ